jgi:hypothetical protein
MPHARLLLLSSLLAACVAVSALEAAAQESTTPPAGSVTQAPQSGSLFGPGAVDVLKGAKEEPSTDPRDFRGMWTYMIPQGPEAFDLLNVPLLPKTQAILERDRSYLTQGKIFATATTTCRSSAVNATLFPFNITAILQTDDEVVIVFQQPREVRRIRLNGVHPKDITPSYRGDSVGKWDGNTLVVDTIGFNGIFEIASSGLPTSTQLHMIERIEKSSDGKSLNFEITLSDPEYYFKPFTVKRKWEFTGGDRQLEFDCEENPRVETDRETVYARELYRPVCVRVEGQGNALSHVVCNNPKRVK